MAEGFGKLVHDSGDMQVLNFMLSYEGQWNKGKAHGTGTYTTLDVTYMGEWLADKQHGWGKETWRGGDVYEGEFMFGQKQGKGKFNWADGSRLIFTVNDQLRGAISGESYAWLGHLSLGRREDGS